MDGNQSRFCKCYRCGLLYYCDHGPDPVGCTEAARQAHHTCVSCIAEQTYEIRQQHLAAKRAEKRYRRRADDGKADLFHQG